MRTIQSQGCLCHLDLQLEDQQHLQHQLAQGATQLSRGHQTQLALGGAQLFIRGHQTQFALGASQLPHEPQKDQLRLAPSATQLSRVVSIEGLQGQGFRRRPRLRLEEQVRLLIYILHCRDGLRFRFIWGRQHRLVQLAILEGLQSRRPRQRHLVVRDNFLAVRGH